MAGHNKWDQFFSKIIGTDAQSQARANQNQAIADYISGIGQGENNEFLEEQQRKENRLLIGVITVTGLVAIGTIIYFTKKGK
tara:strand:+ start:128 stop:373 length:246 start_codon:yes stop_codon:yes gene_type:complete